MTFIGWLLILMNVLLLWVYDPDLAACESEAKGQVSLHVCFIPKLLPKALCLWSMPEKLDDV